MLEVTGFTIARSRTRCRRYYYLQAVCGPGWMRTPIFTITKSWISAITPFSGCQNGVAR